MEKNRAGLKIPHLLALLILASFALRLALVHAQPLYLDECLYGEMAQEQLVHPSLVPTYLGFPASWKPPLFFWVYSVPVAVLGHLTEDIELIYRLPNIVFGTLNVLLVFLLFRKISDEKKALCAAALFAFCPLAIATDLRVLLDTLNATFILASLYFHFEKPSGKSLALGALFAFLAAFTKSVVAFVIPIAVFVRYYSRKELSLPALLSLIAVPAGIALHYLILLNSAPSLANEEFMFDVFGKVGAGVGYADKLWLAFIVATVLINILIPAALLGFAKTPKREPGLAAWLGAIAFAVIGSSGMWWYFYPFIPVLAFFSVEWLSREPQGGKEKLDAIFALAIGLMCALGITVTLIYYFNPVLSSGFQSEKAAGLLLENKPNVLFIGDYHSSVTAVAYKTLSEGEMSGIYPDFGWVIFPEENASLQKEMLKTFVSDYGSVKFPLDQDNFAKLFWNLTLFRKPSAIRQFDYVVFSPVPAGNDYKWAQNLTLNGYETIQRNETILVFRKIGN